METRKAFYATVTMGGVPFRTEQEARDYIKKRVDVGKNPQKWYPSEVEKLGEGRYVINEFYKKEIY